MNFLAPLAFAGLQIVAVALPFAALERIPRARLHRAPWLRPGAGTDALHVVVSHAALAPLGVALAVTGSRALESALGIPRLAADLPLWAGAPLALLALDLGNYAAHLLLHRVDALWELHKVHHSSHALDWLATFRSHVVEQVLRRGMTLALLVAAGFSAGAVTLALVVFLAFAILNHSNVRASSLRFLEPVFVTPRLHRLHHAPATTERNLGAVFSLWDRALGRLVTNGADGDPALGVPGEVDTYPQGWWGHLVLPPARILASAQVRT